MDTTSEQQQRKHDFVAVKQKLIAMYMKNRSIVMTKASAAAAKSYKRLHWDSTGRLVNWPVDSQGRLVDELGRLIDADGNLVDSEGCLVNPDGSLCVRQGLPPNHPTGRRTVYFVGTWADRYGRPLDVTGGPLIGIANGIGRDKASLGIVKGHIVTLWVTRY